jgi:hypothetical protein
MTVAEADINKYSKHEVGEGLPFTPALFATYKVTAKAMLDKMAPVGLDTTTYDYCHALLICHLYTQKLGIIEVRSTRPEAWEFISPGVTGFFLQVMNVLKEYSKPTLDTQSEEESSARVDADMVEMHLDQSAVPVYRET